MREEEGWGERKERIDRQREREREREEECGCENGKMEKMRMEEREREGKRERGNRGRRIVRKKEMRVGLFVCLFSIGVTQSVSRTGLRSDCRRRIKGGRKFWRKMDDLRD